MDIKTFAAAWRSGSVCLHPTDTLPGLSFRPSLKEAEAKFMAVKGRPEDKRPISLIADMSLAKVLFQTLPGAWGQILNNLWPASLSVIWKASKDCPASLVAQDGTVALRMPAWTEDKRWMQELLKELNEPFPSSSVNRSGEAAADDWEKALSFCRESAHAITVPHWQGPQLAESHLKLPSTVIRLHDDGTFAMLREGAISSSRIEEERLRHAGIKRP